MFQLHNQILTTWLVVRFRSQILKSKLYLSIESPGQTHNDKGVHIWSKGGWPLHTIQVKVTFIPGCFHVCLHNHACGNLWMKHLS